MTARRPRRGPGPVVSEEPRLIGGDGPSVLDPHEGEADLGPEEGPHDQGFSPRFDDAEGSVLDDETGPAGGDEDEPVSVRDDERSAGDELEAAEDADVGDLADDIVRMERGVGPHADDREGFDESDDASQVALDEPKGDARDEDEGAEGPEHEPLDPRFDALDGAPPVPRANDDGDEGAPVPEQSVEVGLGPPAFSLAMTDGGAARPLAGPEVWCAAHGTGLTWLAGDGFYALTAAQLESGGASVPLRRVRATGAPEGWITSIVSLGPRALLAAEVGGRVHRSDDGGLRWHPVGSLGDGDASEATVDLLAEPGGGRVWARAHGGGLFRSEDAGRSWEGPLLDAPVQAFTMDPDSATLWLALGGGRPSIAFAREGRVETVLPSLASSPVAIAARGETFAVALARGSGLVRAEKTQAAASWPLLRGVSALAFVATDDGAPLLLGAAHDDVSDRVTVFSAALAADGSARAAQRWVDVAPAGGALPSYERDEDSSVHTLVPLDARGSHVLAITAGGALVLPAPRTHD